MSRKEFDEKCYKETMDCLHASDDVLEEVLKMTENKNAEGDKIQDNGNFAALAVGFRYLRNNFINAVIMPHRKFDAVGRL